MEKKQSIDNYPGYPSYPASEDITRSANNTGRERLDEEQQPVDTNNNGGGVQKDKEFAKAPANEADVTPADLRLLEMSEQNMVTPDSRNLAASSLDDTDNDGDLLNTEGSLMTNVSGDDLDLPDIDRGEGDEDEENNFYSLGGDNHDSLEESR